MNLPTGSMNLPPGSISSWDDLCHQFVANFQGTFTRPGLECDIHVVKQQEGETLRCFIQHFSQVRNTIPRITPHAVIVAFRQGVRNEWMLEKRGTHEVETTAERFALADRCAKAAEARAWHVPCPEHPAADQLGPSRSDKWEKKKRKNVTLPLSCRRKASHVGRHAKRLARKSPLP